MTSRTSLVPDAEQELLLAAGLREGSEAQAAWHSWRTGRELDDLQRAGLAALPLAFRNLSRLGLLDGDPDAGRIRGVYRRSWVNNQLLFEALERAVAVLASGGIRALVLKGAALNHRYYSDGGERPMSDVDLLVDHNDLERAIELLGTIGFSGPKVKLSRARTRMHALGLDSEQTGQSLDLHWYSLWLSSKDDDFWADAVEISIRDQSALALCPTDQLLHSIAHGVTDMKSFLWVADASRIVTASDIDWDRFQKATRARHLTAQVGAALAYLNDRGWIDVPAEVRDRLNPANLPRWERAGLRALDTPTGPVRAVRFARNRRRRMRETLAPEQVPSLYAAIDGLGAYRHPGQLLIDGPRAIARSLARPFRDR